MHKVRVRVTHSIARKVSHVHQSDYDPPCMEKQVMVTRAARSICRSCYPDYTGLRAAALGEMNTPPSKLVEGVGNTCTRAAGLDRGRISKRGKTS